MLSVQCRTCASNKYQKLTTKSTEKCVDICDVAEQDVSHRVLSSFISVISVQ